MPLKMNITLSKDSKSFSTIKARLFISKSSNQNSHHCIKMVRFLQLVIVTTPNECSLDFFFLREGRVPEQLSATINLQEAGYTALQLHTAVLQHRSSPPTLIIHVFCSFLSQIALTPLLTFPISNYIVTFHQVHLPPLSFNYTKQEEYDTQSNICIHVYAYIYCVYVFIRYFRETIQIILFKF